MPSSFFRKFLCLFYYDVIGGPSLLPYTTMVFHNIYIFFGLKPRDSRLMFNLIFCNILIYTWVTIIKLPGECSPVLWYYRMVKNLWFWRIRQAVKLRIVFKYLQVPWGSMAVIYKNRCFNFHAYKQRPVFLVVESS